ncbi:hypothetical protein RhiirC2_795336 [Rhizophagus irregularis]|uniref:Uncharacterized protein n=1 Tax=Rhizophagus irregularis TaxID=588596 RepID=A0A2N1MBV9_9GLOM|nr:hypothetical protein RhiirC2_795336 [Rhizophagus irregularis]
MSSRHVKSSFVIAKFIMIDDDVNIYPSQVQYYFTHTVDLPNGPTEHFLAYVRWYKHAGSRNIQYYFSNDNDINICSAFRWANSNSKDLFGHSDGFLKYRNSKDLFIFRVGFLSTETPKICLAIQVQPFRWISEVQLSGGLLKYRNSKDFSAIQVWMVSEKLKLQDS